MKPVRVILSDEAEEAYNELNAGQPIQKSSALFSNS